MKEGRYKLTDLDIVELRKLVIPYDKIIETVKNGEAYVLDKKVKQSTISNAITRLNDTLTDRGLDVKVRLMKLKNGQYVVVPIIE